MKTSILFLSLVALLNLSSAFADSSDVVLNDSNVSLPALDAGEELTLIRTSRTPDKVELQLAANAQQEVCTRYDVRYVYRTDPQCGYDYTYIQRCHVERICRTIPGHPNRTECRNQNVCRLERIASMRTCALPERYCAASRPVNTVIADSVKLKFKNGDLRDGEAETYVLRMGIKNNYTSYPSIKAELDSLDGDTVKRRTLTGNFVVKD